MKKLRSKRGEAAVEREVKERVKGSEFFEFKCGGKNPQ